MDNYYSFEELMAREEEIEREEAMKEMINSLKKLMGEEDEKYVDEWRIKEMHRKKRKKSQWKKKKEENMKKINLIVAVNPIIYDYCFMYRFYLMCTRKEGSQLMGIRFDEFLTLDVIEMIIYGNIDPEDLKSLM